MRTPQLGADEGCTVHTPGRPEASRWVTFDILRSLNRLDRQGGEEWVGMEPSTPYRSYPQKQDRY